MTNGSDCGRSSFLAALAGFDSGNDRTRMAGFGVETRGGPSVGESGRETAGQLSAVNE